MIASLESIPPPTITVQMSCVHGSATTGAVALDRAGRSAVTATASSVTPAATANPRR